MFLAQNRSCMGIFFTCPLYLQVVQGYDALKTGVQMLPVSIAMFVTAMGGVRFSTPIVGAHDRPGRPGHAARRDRCPDSTIEPELDTTSFAVAMAVDRVGMGLIVSQLGNVAQSAVDGRRPERGGRPAVHRAAARLLARHRADRRVLITGLITSFSSDVSSDPQDLRRGQSAGRCRARGPGELRQL